jgi:hypothetical protein
MRWAIVQGGIVDNIILWDGDTSRWAPPAGAEAIQLAEGQACSIGWEWDGTQFSEPAEP